MVSPLYTDAVYLVWTRLTFHIVTRLYHACHVTYILLRVFDVTVYAINVYSCEYIFFNCIFNECYFFYCYVFPQLVRFWRQTMTVWYINEYCAICLISSYTHPPLYSGPSILLMFIHKTTGSQTTTKFADIGSIKL